MVKKRNVGKKTLINSKNRVAEEKCKSAIRDKGKEIERSSFVEYGGRFLDENIIFGDILEDMGELCVHF